MAIRFSIDFVGITTNAELITNGAAVADGSFLPTGSKDSDNCYYLGTSHTEALSYLCPFVDNLRTITFYFQTESLANSPSYICHINSDKGDRLTGRGVYLSYDADGTVHLHDDAGNKKISTSAGVLVAAAWTHIEFKVITGNTGQASLKIDDVVYGTDVAGDYKYTNSDPWVLFAGDVDGHRFHDIVIQDDSTTQPEYLGLNHLDNNPEARITRQIAEVVASNDASPDTRITRETVEVVASNDASPDTRITRAVAEVVTSAALLVPEPAKVSKATAYAVLREKGAVSKVSKATAYAVLRVQPPRARIAKATAYVVMREFEKSQQLNVKKLSVTAILKAEGVHTMTTETLSLIETSDASVT